MAELQDPDGAFAEEFRRRRVDAGLSQADVAAAMTAAGHEFHQTTVGKFERGERRVSIGEALSLADVLRTSVEKMVGGADGLSRQRSEMRDIAARLARTLSDMSVAADTLAELQSSLRGAVEAYDAEPHAEPFEPGGPTTASAFFRPLLEWPMPSRHDPIPTRELIDLYWPGRRSPGSRDG